MEAPEAVSTKPTAVSSFLSGFFTPQLLNSFHAPFEDEVIRVLIFRSAEAAPDVMEIKNIFPMMTIQDLKTQIYIQQGKSALFYPSYQALLQPMSLGDEDVDVNTIAQLYKTLDFTWMKAGGSTENDIHDLINPWKRMTASSVDEFYVTSDGQKKLTNFVDRSRITLEELLFGKAAGNQVTLHLFLYADLYAKLPTALRVSQREWFGRLEPYFPGTNMSITGSTLTAEQTTKAEKNIMYVTRTLQILNRLDELIQVEEVPMRPIRLTGIKFLRLVWKNPEPSADALETLFYKLNVSHERPFLRILPADASAITKLRTQSSVIRIPDIGDPRLLLQWAQERSPNPDKDYLFAKVIVRREIGTQPALYGTLRLFDDRTADFILLPPKQLRKFDPSNDLNDFGNLLEKGLEDTPYTDQVPQIGEANITCAIDLDLKAEAITKNSIRERLKLFQPLFQEIPALPGDQPLVMLRYKGVSNFAIQDRMFAFLTQLKTRRIVKGEMLGAQFLKAFEEEFQVSSQEAEAIVNKWIVQESELDFSIPESKDYILRNNPGVDIAIYAQHPFYSFHLYRVESALDLDRILTALSLLFSAEDEQLKIPIRAVAEYADAQTAVIKPSGIAELPSAPPTEEEEQAEGLIPGSARIEPLPTNRPYEEPIVDDDAPSRVSAFQSTWGDMFMGQNEPGDDEDEGVLNLGNAEEAAAVKTVGKVNVGTLVKANVPVAAPQAPVMPIQAKPEPVAMNEEDDEEMEETMTGKKGKKLSYKWYLKSKLQEADQRLFVYDSKLPGVKIKKYVTMCQATETRQPAVLNQEQFNRMRKVYEEDDLSFLVYPIQDESPLPAEGTEYYTVLRYGSDPNNQNYYLCCEFFCVKDYILVRAEDFYSNKDRKGKAKVGESRPGAKDRGSCPFCHGLEIKTLGSPGKDETVIHRKLKQKSDRRHLFVGFLKDTYHPEGFYQPCCFLDDRKLRLSDREFAHIRAATVMKEDEEAPIIRTTVTPALDYYHTLLRAHKKYIVGPEKFPLKLGEATDGPQIGLLFPIIDAYFGQSPMNIVSREFNRMELKPDAKGFLRIGVENRSTYLPDSFLAAIAPFLRNLNSASDVKSRLLEVIHPRQFMFLNYGNLVLEFYDPSDPKPNITQLRQWAKDNLSIDMNPTENYDAVERLWMSYHNFQRFLEDTTTLKEYRQFAQALASENFITPRGIVFIVLDIVLDEDGTERLEVRCPPFGYNYEEYKDADIGFLVHHFTGVWEPVFFTENYPAVGDLGERHQPTIRFERSLEAAWPDIVKKRVSEFTRQCSGSGVAMYTSQAGIDPKAMIPLRVALQALPMTPTGIIRDAYNHIAGITYRATAGKQGLVAIPVVDDGTHTDYKFVHLDWNDYTPAPMDKVVDFYKKYGDAFSLYPGYQVARRVKSRGTEEYVAVKLANGLYVPAAPPKDETVIRSLDLDYVDEMEWTLNREIAYGSRKDDIVPKEILMRAEESDLTEIYEHLRVTFSGWLTREASEGPLREKIESIIYDKKLPLFERRKRLEITLGSTILSWMNDTIPVSGDMATLLRLDCSVQTQPNCSGRCVWRQGTETNVGRCYLHTPKEARLGSRMVNGPRLLMLRLLEELLRFPARRKQLLEGQVSTLAQLKDRVCIKDTCIYPENTLAWFDLLRLDWMATGEEKKKFFEEMSVSPETSVPPPVVISKLPPALQRFLTMEDPNTKNLHLILSDPGSKSPYSKFLLPLFGVTPLDLDLPEDITKLTAKAIKQLVLMSKKPIAQIDFTEGDEPAWDSYGPLAAGKSGEEKCAPSKTPVIFVVLPEGPGLLSLSPDRYQFIPEEAMPLALAEAVINDCTGVSSKQLAE